MGYLYANFSLPRPVCSRLRPDVRDRQPDVRQSDAHHRLMPPTLVRGIACSGAATICPRPLQVVTCTATNYSFQLNCRSPRISVMQIIVLQLKRLQSVQNTAARLLCPEFNAVTTSHQFTSAQSSSASCQYGSHKLCGRPPH